MLAALSVGTELMLVALAFAVVYGLGCVWLWFLRENRKINQTNNTNKETNDV